MRMLFDNAPKEPLFDSFEMLYIRSGHERLLCQPLCNSHARRRGALCGGMTAEAAAPSGARLLGDNKAERHVYSGD